ncbi:AEC family transporter [uncultured Veillonella sp.]|uniref:AEC family transporter n=1 Tax=uncultured Veillonella sp. TaxID=159268 RepID=UPI00262C60C3|nr:AEC family transporter [uncultured Veillonella sp.]
MTLFLHIFWTSVIPILALVVVGFILDKKFNLDLRSLSKLNFFILLPAYVFRSLYTAHLNHESIEIAIAAFVILCSNGIMAWGASKFMGYDQRKTQIIKNATMFNNGGNIGIAIATFVFSNMPYIVDGQTPYLDIGIVAVIGTFIIQTIFCNTLGFYQAGSGLLTRHDALQLVFHMPVLYVAPLALLLRLIPYDLTTFVLWSPVNIFASAFVGMAMITLGVQISRTPYNFFKKDVMVATTLRLIGGPLLSAFVMFLFIIGYGPVHPVAAQAIIITYSVPSAVNTALIAFEMRNNPELATQIVMATTVLSAITLPLAIMFAYYVYPIL